MADEQPVPETLESIAASIRELRTSMESRFGQVDDRFGEVDKRFDTIERGFGAVDKRFDTIERRFGAVDKRFDTIDRRFGEGDKHFNEMKAQLRTEIESVRGDVRLVAVAVAGQTVLLQRLERDHQRLEGRVDRHDLRLLALEPKQPA